MKFLPVTVPCHLIDCGGLGEEGLCSGASAAAQGAPHPCGEAAGLWQAGCNPRYRRDSTGSLPAHTAGSFQWGGLAKDRCKLDLYLIPSDLRYLLKTEGKRSVEFRDGCVSKFVVMAVFLSCQEHPRFSVNFQLFKPGNCRFFSYWSLFEFYNKKYFPVVSISWSYLHSRGLGFGGGGFLQDWAQRENKKVQGAPWPVWLSG